MDQYSLPVNVTVRNKLLPGDIGAVIHHHGKMYHDEFGYGIVFEKYVAEGLLEFTSNYNSDLDKVWIIERDKSMIAFLLLMHRPENTAQLRYFFVLPQFRGSGIGVWLINEFMNFLTEKKYDHSYLWTTSELTKAARLYTNAGFSLTEEKDSNFGKPVTEQKYVWTKNK